MARKQVENWQCWVGRSATILGDRWTLLILREALLGTTRFADFQANLGVAPDVLTDRLSTLVEYDVMTQRLLPRARPAHHARRTT